MGVWGSSRAELQRQLLVAAAAVAVEEEPKQLEVNVFGLKL